MSSTRKAGAPTVDQPAHKLKPAKEKKPKQPKTASHPPYFQMIKDALLALNEKGGSSPYAIAKYMEEKHKAELPANFRKILALQLKKQAAKGKLIKIKASYKLSEAAKKEKKSSTIVSKSNAEKEKKKKQPRPKQSEATTAKLSKKTEAGKKVGVKKTIKSSPAKPKQPKSIKSPAKRARKTTA